MKALSAFYSRILPHLPGCPEPVVDQMLLTSAIEFCEKSQVLRQNLDPFSTVADIGEYDLDSPSAQLIISRVLGVTADGIPLVGDMAESFPRYLPVDSGIPSSFYVDRTDSQFVLRLLPTPDDVYRLVTTVALRPAMTATQLEDDLYNRWVEPVVSGAIYRAMLLPDQPFTNYARASQVQMETARHITNSRIEGNYGHVRGSMRVRSRPFV
jgi:hypothetical protein